MATNLVTGAMSPQNIQIAQFLAHYSDSEVMNHFIGHQIQGAPPALNESMIVALDMESEWWQTLPHPTTEIGISELQPQSVLPSVLAENILTEIRVAHARIMPVAHLMNNFQGAGNPEEFHFGKTKFVTQEEAAEILFNSFRRPRIQDDGSVQPIIFLGHACTNELEHIGRNFGLDLFQIGSIVRVLDTQTMAKEAGLNGLKGPNISLGDLLGHFHITPLNLHSAGNDAGYTMISAVLTALRSVNYGPFAKKRPSTPAIVNNRHIMDVISRVMAINQTAEQPPWGRELFCTKCDRINHLRADCFTRVFCEYCGNHEDSSIRKGAKTHMTSKCFYILLLYRNNQ